MLDTLNLLLMGFHVALSVQNLLAAILGAVLGLIVGAMPGIGSLAGCALLLPLTFQFNPTTGIIMLGAVYYANMFGGAFSSILVNIPGDSPAIMTTLDGYPMAQKGLPGKALATANFSSFVGGLLGMIILTLFCPVLVSFGLKFGPTEMTALLFLAMTSIGWLMGESPTKGIIMTCVGILIGTIGTDTVVGTVRYTFGNVYLLGGIPFMALGIGMFGFTQVIDMAINPDAQAVVSRDQLTFRKSVLSIREMKAILPVVVRSGFLGCVVGIMPGAGATTAAFVSYATEKRFGKNSAEMGKGAPEGIAASEAANNGAAAGAFAPLLSLGIPGSGTGAVLLGGLMMWGLKPGPLLFRTNPDFAWGLIASLFLANIITLIIAYLIIPHISKVLCVPKAIMVPAISLVCIVGSYTATYSMYGVWVMLLSGLAGYFLIKNNYPLAPLLLAYVLTRMLEINMRRTFQISRGSIGIFFQKPLSLAFIIAMILIVGFPLVKAARRKWLARAGAKDGD